MQVQVCNRSLEDTVEHLPLDQKKRNQEKQRVHRQKDDVMDPNLHAISQPNKCMLPPVALADTSAFCIVQDPRWFTVQSTLEVSYEGMKDRLPHSDNQTTEGRVLQRRPAVISLFLRSARHYS